MVDFKVALVYFSATNVTHTYAQVISQALLDQGCTVQLFNVSDDPGEQNDLAQGQTARAAELLARLRSWRKDVSAHMMPAK